MGRHLERETQRQRQRERERAKWRCEEEPAPVEPQMIGTGHCDGNSYFLGKPFLFLFSAIQ